MDLQAVERAVARLHEDEPAFDWVGVYLLEGDVLALGPFRGRPTDHVRIPLPEGVCGAVAASGVTEVVPDVRARPGHITCDLDTRSEAVAPILAPGREREGPAAVLGVLDVDSNAPDAFGEREVEVIERAAAALAQALAPEPPA